MNAVYRMITSCGGGRAKNVFTRPYCFRAQNVLRAAKHTIARVLDTTYYTSVFEDEELEALLDEDCCQTQEELAESLGVTQAAIPKRLKAAGYIQKQGNWVPHELKPRDVGRRFCMSEILLESH